MLMLSACCWFIWDTAACRRTVIWSTVYQNWTSNDSSHDVHTHRLTHCEARSQGLRGVPQSILLHRSSLPTKQSDSDQSCFCISIVLLTLKRLERYFGTCSSPWLFENESYSFEIQTIHPRNQITSETFCPLLCEKWKHTRYRAAFCLWYYLNRLAPLSLTNARQ